MLATDLPSKTGYQLAQNMGRSIAESAFQTLNDRADALAQEIVDLMTQHAGKKVPV